MEAEVLKDIYINVTHSVPTEERNKPQWKYGWNEKFDVVCISTEKKLGEIIEIDGLRIGLPPLPNKNKILNHDKRREKQIWARHDLPEDLQNIDSDEQFLKMGDSFVSKHMPYIKDEFKLDSKESKRLLMLWMANFNDEGEYNEVKE